MIAKTLITFSELLDDYLKRVFSLNESIVLLQPAVNNSASQLPDNKLHVFLANIVRETAGGIACSRQQVSYKEQKTSQPVWKLNLYVMIAACFNGKQYEMALHSISAVSAFLQANSHFHLPETNTTIQIEPVSLASNELSNLWSIYGNQYYPSLFCLMRNILIDSAEIQKFGKIIQ